jgi:hypothetical protein
MKNMWIELHGSMTSAPSGGRGGDSIKPLARAAKLSARRASLARVLPRVRLAMFMPKYILYMKKPPDAQGTHHGGLRFGGCRISRRKRS